MNEDKLNKTIHRTEEVKDIIDRMPHRTGNIVLVCLILFTGLLLFFGYIIKYPEAVTGMATISASQAPVRLTAPVSGRLHLLVKNNTNVREGRIFAYMENGADMKDFFFLDSVMQLGADYLLARESSLTSHLFLGELTMPYLKFLNSIKAYNLYKNSNPFIPKLNSLNIQTINNEKLIGYLANGVKVQEENTNINLQTYLKDSIQYYHLKSINELQFLQRRSAYLNSLKELNSLKKEKDLSVGLANELKEKINQLGIEKQETEQNLEMNLFSTYNELKSQIKLWKQKYTFISPFNGKLEMLSFWKDNTFLQVNQEVFAIIPVNTPYMAQVVIPSIGAGKIISGQEVIIRLDDFPFQEFGSIKGEVQSVSLLGNNTFDINPQQKITTYLVNVSLPEQLKTNYGSKLNFKHDIKGTASILVKKRKLIERLFDNLKYLVNE